jgi:hypothetical protein
MQTITFQELSLDQLKIVFEQFYNTKHAYGVLASVFGYSFTEFQIEIKNSPEAKESFAIVTPEGISAVIQLEQIDWISRSMRIYLGVQLDQNFNEIKTAIKYLLDTLWRFKGLTRFYTYLLSDEQAEKEILAALGFTKEVHLDEHVYIDGHYRDLEIWGTTRK